MFIPPNERVLVVPTEYSPPWLSGVLMMLTGIALQPENTIYRTRREVENDPNTNS